MKKTITETRSRTVEVCDLCERDCSNGFHNHCYICGRQTCLTCSRLIDFVREMDKSAEQRRILELPLKICCECEKVGESLPLVFIERINAACVGANHKVVELLDQWRELAKKWRGKTS